MRQGLLVVNWAIILAIVRGAGLAVCLLSFLSACAATQSADEQELAMTMKEHGNDTPVASPIAAYEPARPVSGKAVAYTTVDGKEIQGWLSRPDNATGDLPALIVIHEWWGLNDEVRAMADRIAAEGYVVLAVDLFGGSSARSPADARTLMVNVIENPDLAN